MRELLFSVTKKDLTIQYFSGTGAGGQYRNKHQNCVRMYHADSGVRVTGQSHRERQSNLREAFNTLIKHPKFKLWHSARTQECLSRKSIDEIVAESMEPEHLKVESRDERGRWVSHEQQDV